MLNKLRLKNMVEMMLKDNDTFNGVSVRDSDVALTIRIWQRWYSVGTNIDSTIQLRRLFDLPREDNVKRARAQLQNIEGKYLPTNWKVAKARKIERKVWEAALGYNLSHDDLVTHHTTQKENKEAADRVQTLFKVDEDHTRGLL